MKITNENKKTIVIKEAQVDEVILDLDTDEVLDLNALVKTEFANKVVKITIAYSEKDD